MCNVKPLDRWQAQLAKKKTKSSKRVLVEQIFSEMEKRGLGKRDLARKMKTSRSQLDRVLSPDVSVSLHALEKTAKALGCRIVYKLSK
jgi:transcriptional regulator with XRE-family HTH domain